jgi:coiled-coil domain-containing protein 130
MAEWGAPKYHPPAFFESGAKSINKFRGVHALRERARKLKTEGILIIRFEMPFNIWCLSCNDMIGKGTRFNAEKSDDGFYHSTKILKFAMKCAKCKNKIIIHTDPQNCDYKVTSGAKKKEEEFQYDPLEDNVAVLTDPEILEKRENNAMAKLEHLQEDYTKSLELVPALTQLQQIRDNDWKSDYELSSILRKKNRETKQQQKAELEQFEKRFGSGYANEDGDGLAISKETEQDRELAKDFVFKRQQKPNVVSSIFAKPNKMSQAHGAIITASLKKKTSKEVEFDVVVKKKKSDKKSVSSLSLLQAYKT